MFNIIISSENPSFLVLILNQSIDWMGNRTTLQSLPCDFDGENMKTQSVLLLANSW